ncbi:MAG: hypothetical protein U9N45_02510 [Gemmatimonadota bacterium]|nr:hypothetical protein [Gemmatimonadota bacterium]
MTDYPFLRPGLTLLKTFRLQAPPRRMKEIHFSRRLSWAEYARVRRGLVPLTPVDKWLVCHNRSTLYFFRSGSGVLVYKVRFAHSALGFDVTGAWVNNDPEAIDPLPEEYECRLLGYLVDRLMLNLETSFPLPEGTPDDRAAFLERLWMGDGRTSAELPPSDVFGQKII